MKRLPDPNRPLGRARVFLPVALVYSLGDTVDEVHLQSSLETYN